jgi:hypothetical protein
MEFKKEREVNKGLLVNWVADQAMNLSAWISRVASPYAEMYTAVWDDYEDEDILSTPQNQMGLFNNELETLPQFEWIGDDLL